MVTFEVDDMTCGRCATAIARAVASVEPAVQVEVRIAQKLVRIDGQASAAAFAQAIQGAGYTPREVEAGTLPAAPARSAGCCCAGKRAQAEASHA